MATLTLEQLNEREFLLDFIQSGLDWKVNDHELISITSRKQFIETHIRNSNSCLLLTQRVLCYPTSVIFALSTITDEYCLRRLLNYLATEGSILFGPLNPHFVSKEIESILVYLFGYYYRHRLREQIVDVHVMTDYINMALNCKQVPNLRIKSFKRLISEHDKLVRAYEYMAIPEFNLPEIGILPPEKDGYFFSMVSTKSLLVAEAEEMQHCVASYADEIISGQSVIYSVWGKERATVEFMDFGDGYSMAQVSSYRNKEVSEELFELLCALTYDCDKRAPENARVDQHYFLDECPF